MIQFLKEKIKSIISAYQMWGVPEQLALAVTVLAFVLVLVVVVVVITFVLPKTRIEIGVVGPEKAKAGEEISYVVTIKNSGNVILKNPELVFQYPSFSLPEKSLIETRRLGNIYPRQEKSLTFKARLFGREGETREFKTWLNYSTERRPTITMSRIANFSTVISEVPIDLVLDIPKKAPVHPEEPSKFIFRIRYFSFSDQTISNLKLAIDFPPDFTFQESIPASSQGREFEIPTLEPSTGGEVEVAGSFPAGYQTGKELKFNVQLSINLQGADVLLKEGVVETVTYEPIFSLSQKINNQENYFPYPGEKLYYQIYFKNIQNEPLKNLTLTTVLEGNLYDLTTIEAPSGTFTKGTNFISWDGSQIPELRYLTPGQQGKVEFWVSLKSDYRPKDLTETNASIRNRVILADFETEFRYRVSSLIKISQEGYFQDKYGFFENLGPHPPEINQTSHYTIVWKLENYYNWIEEVTVKATLPGGVSVRRIKTAKEGEINVLTYPTPIRSPYPDIPTTFRFEKPLYEGLRDSEVVYLQLILKTEVPRLYPASLPATGYFGPITREAVKGFQEKYKKEILEPQGLSIPSGYIDELTRLKLNELLIKVAPPAFAEVVWKIDKVRPGVGVFEEPLVAAFQIAFTPEITQRGKIATLINEIRVSVKDRWTGFPLYVSDKGIDTTLPHDPTVKGEGKIR